MDQPPGLHRAGRFLWLFIAGACLAAFVLRMYQLATPALRWDEGWTIAHGTLPWPEVVRIAALEWHPPLFYLLYKGWQSLVGVTPFAVRYLAVLAGVLTIPLTYVATMAWASDRRVAVAAALCNAALPLLIYYGQVNRMYAWTPVGVLLATWALLRATEKRTLAWAVGAGIATAFALYFLYYTVWPLLALYLYVLLARPRAWRAWLLAAGIALFLFAPWLVYASGTLEHRIQAGPLLTSLRNALEFVGPSVFGLVFAYGRGWAAVGVVGGVLLVGLLLTSPRRWLPMLFPVLGITIAVMGVSYGAQAVRFFAVRHFVPVAPLLGLALAWALEQMRRRSGWLLALAIAVLMITFWPVRSDIYAKGLEVVDPFDPAADWRYLSPLLRSGDIVFFNNLAKAGWYEASRQGRGAPWSYTLAWEPIVEPLPVITGRVEAAMEDHPRLWFVLYKGTLGANTDLRAWLDAHPRLYPMWEGWVGDTLVLGYVVPQVLLEESPVRGILADGRVELTRARFTPTADSGVAVELEWHVLAPLSRPVKVFVHLMSTDGRLVAQHDAPLPASCGASMGMLCTDRHGVAVPADTIGSLILRIGLYDEETGERLRWRSGEDALTLGGVRIATQSSSGSGAVACLLFQLCYNQQHTRSHPSGQMKGCPEITGVLGEFFVVE
ncbi:MAG: glycosyltransferase family 39 protein [Anaerolineae bacterium]|nr:glycosyltransferase family 39 protein [Anaerolineae bacterium]